jgi:hypothetical protein
MYMIRETTRMPTKRTALQLRSSRVTGMVFGQKDQKKVKVTYIRPRILTGTPHFPRLQRALEMSSGGRGGDRDYRQ